MEWIECLRKAIDLMEGHLLEKCDIGRIAGEIGISDIYLQKGFKFISGYTMAEYMRNRRLYLAALDVIAGKGKVIDLAYRYGYETPESFTRAFARFHGVTPMQLKKDASRMHVFLPLKIKISIQGGYDMDYIMERESGFQVIGFERRFSMEDSYRQIPQYWDEFCARYLGRLMQGAEPENEVEEAICNYHVGMYGVCLDDLEVEGEFRYLIAGKYTGGNVPEGMTVYEFPDMQWAKFLCKGPMPEALQSVNTKIFREWLPGNPDYEVAMGANIEWYGEGDTNSVDYESAIWLPVKKKGE